MIGIVLDKKNEAEHNGTKFEFSFGSLWMSRLNNANFLLETLVFAEFCLTFLNPFMIFFEFCIGFSILTETYKLI